MTAKVIYSGIKEQSLVIPSIMLRWKKKFEWKLVFTTNISKPTGQNNMPRFIQSDEQFAWKWAHELLLFMHVTLNDGQGRSNCYKSVEFCGDSLFESLVPKGCPPQRRKSHPFVSATKPSLEVDV